MKIKIFTTGGSIDKCYSPQESAFIVGPPQVAEILAAANITVDYQIEPLLQKDSLDITYEDRSYIFEKVSSDPADRILITHGTDTLIETAKTLQEITDKVIVLTGAFQPAAFKKTDAVFNLGAAFIALQTLPAGVHVVINGKVFDPAQAHKSLSSDTFQEL